MSQASPIDWSAPWFEPYRELGREAARLQCAGCSVAQSFDQLAESVRRIPNSIDQGDAELALLPRFIDATRAPADEPYESFIARSGCVPTRDDTHDFFNGLVWLAHPALKWQMNRLQAAEIATRGVGPERGAVRDALTVFDENGAIWEAPVELVDALGRRDWRTLFVERHADWARSRLTLIGHALLDKLAQPRKAITMHVWAVPLPLGALPALPTSHQTLAAGPVPLAAGRIASLADAVAGRVENLRIGTPVDKPWLPLPVLGVPGWWSSNLDPAFYDDASVFRAPTSARKP
jgi:hypothetical protein